MASADEASPTPFPDFLSADALAPDPMEQFARWYTDAEAAGEPEPEAMSVATVGADATPSVRIALLKQADKDGFVFYTNRGSRKGREIAGNAAVALAWRWARLDRQVRVTGHAHLADDRVSDAYFATRGRGSQLGAWASRQSQVLAGRTELEQRLAAAHDRFAGGEVPRPPWWGGYVVVPDTVEFWQGRPDRLHDRLRYRGGDAVGWTIERLSP
jgi:pyridoxamine 5'-phosphate oxidase